MSIKPIMKWEQLLCDERFGHDQEQGSARDLPFSSHRIARTGFERDYDRMIFSAPFRRLQNKAQIFPLPGKVFVHNRLTHSLEVSCVGRSLGTYVALGLSEKYHDPLGPWIHFPAIVSAACLAHDMGNPPFGHSGERAIRAYFAEGPGQRWETLVLSEGNPWTDFSIYEGNANALRLLTHRFEGRRPGGFALTYSTLAAMVKYPWESALATENNNKFGFFATEKESYKQIANKLGIIQLSQQPLRFVRHPLVFLMEAADDICYQIMDLEDAYKLRLVSLQEVCDLLINYFEGKEKEYYLKISQSISDNNERVAFLRSKAINQLTEHCAEIFLQNEEQLLQGTFTSPLISLLPEPLLSAYKACSDVAYQKIYSSRDVVDVELAGHRIFSVLIEKLMDSLLHPNYAYSRTLLSRVSSQYNTQEATVYGKLLCTLDYISGMTDLFALDLYRRITGMNLPAV